MDAVNALRAPVQLDYEEGSILNAGLRIVQGLTPYPDPHSWPVALNPYGPIPYLLVAALVKTFGVSFTAPRIAIVLCGVAVAALLLILLRHFGCGAYSRPHILGSVRNARFRICTRDPPSSKRTSSMNAFIR